MRTCLDSTRCQATYFIVWLGRSNSSIVKANLRVHGVKPLGGSKPVSFQRSLIGASSVVSGVKEVCAQGLGSSATTLFLLLVPSLFTHSTRVSFGTSLASVVMITEVGLGMKMK